MQRIQLLESSVVDQIAAGEVIERPAQLVKELIENALDAEASEIRVEYSLGGKSIRVSDNGYGIQKEDLAKALARFATSKIRKSDDLFQLSSFGFRGEALASASAISRLSLVSKARGAQSAFRIESSFGVVSDIAPSSHAEGCTVQIEELFANVPVRLKFLKTDSAEASQIRLVVKAMAMAFPKVSFKLTAGGELIDYFPAQSSWLERCSSVMGMSLHLIEGQRGPIQVQAAFSDPYTVAKSSRNIWLFAQDRWIQDRALTVAILESYRHLLMHGEYPYVVLKVQTPKDEIDVNIHPTKSQVKFQNSSEIFRAVSETLRKGLELAPWRTGVQEKIQWQEALAPPEKQKSLLSSQDLQDNLSFEAPELKRSQFLQKNLRFESEGAKGLSSEQYLALSESRPSVINSAEEKGSAAGSSFWQSLQILGQAHLTYILCQSKDGIILVDQHAAHERINFEKLQKAFQHGQFEVQDFLFPLTLELPADLLEAILQQQEALARLGIRLEQLGPQSLGINSSPSFIKEAALITTIEKMAAEIRDLGGSFSLERKIGDYLATMACHSSVRAGQALSFDEMKALLVEMDAFPLSSFCPHGRPVSVNYGRNEIERDFGRIN